MAELLIENIIVTTQLNQHLDLSNLAAAIPNSTYNKSEEPVLIIRFQNPKRAVFILPDGQLFCTGITSLDKANETITQLFGMLEQKGIIFSIVPQLSIDIITVTTTIEQPLQLTLVKKALQDENVVYNPDDTPWLEYQISEELTMLIFPSGKLILTGTSSLTDMKTALESLKDKLSSNGVL